MMIRNIILILLLSNACYTQELNWRWADDSMELTMDKETHATTSFGLYFMFKHKGLSDGGAIIATISLGLLKETVDATVPWEEYGRMGGDGFSKYDVVYNLIGLTAAYTVDKLIKSAKDSAKMKPI